MQLTSIQERAVEQILSMYSKTNKVKIDFTAPTGSGKTIMATNLISTLIQRNFEDNLVFVIATPSSSRLPFFFEQKINLYKKSLPYSKFDVQYIESPSSNKNVNPEYTPKLIPEVNKVYIFGKSTFGKNRIFTERNVIDDFVNIIKDKTYKLIYIRDEAHIGGKITIDGGTRKFENLMQTNAHFVVNMTATPDYLSETKKVIISETDLNNPVLNDDKWLLKTRLVPLLNKDIADKNLLSDAIVKFKKIKKEYEKLEKNSIRIRPAMLIQVDNEPSKKEGKIKFMQEIANIKKEITNANLSWVQYFGDNDKDSNRVYKNNFSLEDISKSYSEIDVIIFKIGPSIGWDIPRACLLLQLRNVSSSKLNIQTIGRIRRNSFPNLERNTITDNYYVYSNAPKIEKTTNVYKYDVKTNFEENKLAVIKIKNKSDINSKIPHKSLHSEVTTFLVSNNNKILQTLKTFFIKNEEGIDVYRKETASVNDHIIYTDISNVFIFLKEIDILKSRHKRIFDLIKDSVQKHYQSNMTNQTLYDDVKISLEHLYFILLTKYNSSLKALIRKNISFKPTYKVTLEKYNPNQYVGIYNQTITDTHTDDYKTYLFDIKKNDNLKNLQPLDSYPEKIAFEKLGLEMYKYEQLVNVWCKNITTSNVSSEYLDDSIYVKQSFFDFIIKFTNNIFLYIEVKSVDDIDPMKTKTLKTAYADYFVEREITLFDIPIVICIWTVKNDNSIEQECYYDQKLINKDLNSIAYKEMIKYLSNIVL